MTLTSSGICFSILYNSPGNMLCTSSSSCCVLFSFNCSLEILSNIPNISFVLFSCPFHFRNIFSKFLVLFFCYVLPPFSVSSNKTLTFASNFPNYYILFNHSVCIIFSQSNFFAWDSFTVFSLSFFFGAISAIFTWIFLFFVVKLEDVLKRRVTTNYWWRAVVVSRANQTVSS